jgi:hypothetical protein
MALPTLLLFLARRRPKLLVCDADHLDDHSTTR